MVIYSHTILITVMSEYNAKRVICNTWTGTLANSAEPDQKLQNAASDQGLHCLLKLQEVKGSVKQSEVLVQDFSSQPTLRDSQPTGAVCALIKY